MDEYIKIWNILQSEHILEKDKENLLNYSIILKNKLELYKNNSNFNNNEYNFVLKNINRNINNLKNELNTNKINSDVLDLCKEDNFLNIF